MRLAYPTVIDYALIAQHLRPDEIEQFLAFTGLDTYNPDTAARVWAKTDGPAFALIDGDGMAVAAGGLQPVGPGVLEAWAVGTLPGWDRHWRSITRACRGVIDGAFRDGAKRVQVCALASRVKAHEWYERGLKMQREGVLRAYAGGRDAIMFARVS